MTGVAEYQLLGAEASYYTGKVRAYLRWKGIPFREVLSTRSVFADIIVPRTGVRDGIRETLETFARLQAEGRLDARELE